MLAIVLILSEVPASLADVIDDGGADVTVTELTDSEQPGEPDGDSEDPADEASAESDGSSEGEEPAGDEDAQSAEGDENPQDPETHAEGENTGGEDPEGVEDAEDPEAGEDAEDPEALDPEDLEEIEILGGRLGVPSLLAAQPDLTDPFTIHNTEELLAFAEAYSEHSAEYSTADITFAITSGGDSFALPSDFPGIGTADAPFSGSIRFSNVASTFFVLSTPLFNYISTDASTTLGSSEGVAQLHFTRDSANADQPLFAAHVVAGSSAVEWSVELSAYDGGDLGWSANDFAGVVGEIGAGCDVKFNFVNDSKAETGNPDTPVVNANVSASGNVGLLCNTLGAGATLRAGALSGTNTGFTISSAGGHAGGLVGQMQPGSKLIIENSYDSSELEASVSTTGGGKCAGGLAGYAENAQIIIAANADVSAEISSLKASGGLAGYAENTYISFENAAEVTVTASITGNESLGGVFGCCKVISDSAVSFDLSGFNLSPSLGAGTNAGGVFGQLDNSGSGDISISGGLSGTPVFTGGSRRGGIIGSFKNNDNDLSKNLTISSVSVSANIGSNNENCGGLIGFVENYPAYICVDGGDAVGVNGVSVNVSGSAGGGLVGNLGSAGSFLDIRGNVLVRGGALDAGIVNKLTSGVLRLSGTTDLSGMTGASPNHIVKTHTSALIYSKGSGEDEDWTLIRHTASDYYKDDVGTWGEVVRYDIAGQGLISVDEAAHVVTIGTAPYSEGSVTIGSLNDFISTALNMQLNVSGAAMGALAFAAGGATSEELLASDIELTADIDLSDTGIISLTRDDGSNAAYTGSFNGNDHSITLAAGEAWGLDINGKTSNYAASGSQINLDSSKTDAEIFALDRTSLNHTIKWGQGALYDHTYIGLFAKVQNASFQDLTVDGLMFMRSSSASYAGGVAAQVTGSASFDNVKANVGMELDGGGSGFSAGGLVGGFNPSAAASLSISDSETHTVIYGYTRGGQSSGGFVGKVSGGGSAPVQFSNVTVSSIYYNNRGENGTDDIVYGGLIGKCDENSAVVTVSGAVVKDSFVRSVGNDPGNLGKVTGSLLGGEWLSTNVTIDDVVISTGNTVRTDTAKNIGVLFNAGSGFWKVNSVEFESDAVTIEGPSASRVGLIINRMQQRNGNSGMYLVVDADGYVLQSDSVNISAAGVFDEIAVSSQRWASNNPLTDITENGASVISIELGEALIMDGSSCNSYQNRTAFGQSSVTVNPNARYYYNLEAIRTGSASDAEKLLLWSVNQYIHSGMRQLFPATNPAALTDLDMEGLSYYPVSADISLDGAALRFYNAEIEAGEGVSSASGNTDGVLRSTRGGNSQHYLMHAGLLYNSTGLRVSDVTLEGNVGSPASGGSGFLICGSIGGSANNRQTITIDGLILSGAAIAAADASSYSPLIINNISFNVAASFSNVKTQGYESLSGVAASSLIGDVGSSTATNITLSFSDMVLDARSADAPLASTALDTAYGSHQAVFSRATLLNSFKYNSGSSGIYNYDKESDWGSPQHQVTYGREVSESVEYADSEDKYYGGDVYTNPLSESGGAYDFSSGWLPYVYISYNLASNTHEIRVNVSSASVTVGCGRFDDPYIISDAKQLVSIATIIAGRGSELSSEFRINFPATLDPNPDPVGTDSHTEYSFTEAKAHFNNSEEKLRIYLSTAYYSVAGSFSLPLSGYNGLGYADSSNEAENAKYAFRGMIDGNGNTITLLGTDPLIKNASGAIIKDLNILVAQSNTLTTTDNTAAYKYYGGNASYGPVIAQIMGGDNFIDGVTVSYKDGVKLSAAANSRNIAIGGYVGVVLNGALIFRNMTDSTGLGATNAGQVVYVDSDSADVRLYINPFVGRVVYGYAFSEDLKLNNGTKNYDIPVLGGGTGNLTVDYSAKTVSVANGYGLWALGAIIGSNAGGAKSPADGYESGAGNVWSAYRNYSAARPVYGETVDGVSNKRYAFTENATGTPYIIQQYTSGADARALGKADGWALSIDGDCAPVSGFRGIGCIYDNKGELQFGISSFEGNDHSIGLDICFRQYHAFTGSNNTTYDNYRPNGTAGGLAIINYYNYAELTVNDLNIYGSVVYEVRRGDNGKAIASRAENSIDGVNNEGIMPVAGLFARCANGLTLNNVNMGYGANDLSIDGMKYAAGLVAYYNSNKAFIISECGTNGDAKINVSSEMSAGGLAGLINNAALSITGSDTVINIGEIKRRSTQTGAMEYFGGGCVGELISTQDATISDILVQGGIIQSTGFSTGFSENAKQSVAGGIVGRKKNSGTINIIDCSVQDTGLYGTFASGALGSMYSGTVNITGFSYINTDSNKQISGTYAASGIIARVEQASNGQVEITISDIELSGLELHSEAQTFKDRGCGFMIGTWTSSVNNQKTIYRFSDIKLNSCAIYMDYEKYENNVGMGGLVGGGRCYGVNQPTSGNFLIQGHNILINGLSLVNEKGKNNTIKSVGIVYGNNDGMQNNIPHMRVQIVGLSVNNATYNGTPFYRACGCRIDTSTDNTHENYGYDGKGYIIYADYNAVESDLAGGNLPYVTTSPYVPFDGGSAYTYLTGDGMAVSDNDLAIRAILANNSAYNTYNYSNAYRTLFAPYSGQFSTMAEEFDTALAHDFAVLMLEDTNRINSTNMINSYLRLLTNTTFNYTNDSADVYKVDIYRMTWDGSSFVRTAGDANLKRTTGDNGRFYMLNTDVDTSDMSVPTFSLIDVTFYDPADPSKEAYHLYVPVLVKKLLKYYFRVAGLAGTSYLSSTYESRWGRVTFQNLGVPVTLYAEYDYLRSKEEWQNALNMGDDLLGSYVNGLSLTEYLPLGTRAILVDRQTGLPYYCDEVGGKSAISFSDFTSLNGETYAPANFNDMLDLSASQSAGGKFVRLGSSEGATVKVGDYYYRLEEDGDPSGTRYSITVNNTNVTAEGIKNGSVDMSQQYYITLYTTEGSEVYHDVVSAAKSSMASGWSGWPTKQTNGDGNTNSMHMFLGDLFEEDDFSITTTTVDGLMNEGNDTLDATISVTVRLKESQREALKSFLSDISVELFQSFMLELNVKKPGAGQSVKLISGSPRVSGSYTISNGTATTAAAAYDSGSMNTKASYVEFLSPNIKPYFNSDYTNDVTITAEVSLRYLNGEAIELQFPNNSDPLHDQETGAKVSASSNVDYLKESIESSVITTGGNDTADRLFYTQSENKTASLSYNVESQMSGDYAGLGLNPLDPNPFDTNVLRELLNMNNSESSFNVNTLGVLDLTPISAESIGYDYLAITVKLAQKSDGYVSSLNLRDYITTINGSNAPSAVQYAAVLRRDSIMIAGNPDELSIPLRYKIKSGSSLESSGLNYSNYKITLEVVLCKDAQGSDPLEVSRCSNYVIYTNARLIPDVLDR